MNIKELQRLADNKIKVRVQFSSGKSRWGWVHYYAGRWWLTRGTRVGYSLDTATEIKEMAK